LKQLESTLTSIQKEEGDLKKDISDLKNSITTLETDITNLKKALDPKLATSPNVPFTPELASISANYIASQTYTIGETSTKNFPIECFYETPFANYKVYDNINFTDTSGLSIGDKASNSCSLSPLPIFPAFNYSGCLFMALDKAITSANLSLYFELARNYSLSAPITKTLHYNYLSDAGWDSLKVLSNTTNDFSCSGICTVNLSEQLANSGDYMPSTYNWLAIGADRNNKTSSFANTSFLAPNGVLLKRVLNNAIDSKPTLAADIITKTQKAIPELSSIIQPFASFGGRAPEDQQSATLRTSKQLATKGRVVTKSDYYQLVLQAFPDIYYCKIDHQAEQNSNTLYVVKKIAQATDSDAYSPLVSECEEDKIKKYLSKIASPFVNLAISNFTFQYFTVIATVAIEDIAEKKKMEESIYQQLMVFLSPWIVTTQNQIQIDKGISTTEITSFIQSIEGVIQVESIQLELLPNKKENNINDTNESNKTKQKTEIQQIILKKPDQLLVVSEENGISCKAF